MLKPEDKEILSQSEMFSGLRPESIDLLAKHVKETLFKQGEMICHEGDVGDSMFVVAEGTVSVVKDLGWGQRELQRMGPAQAFGEMSLLSQARRTATVVALTPTRCLEFDSVGFSTLLDQDPHFGQRIAKVLTQRLTDVNNNTSHELIVAYRALMFALAHLTESRDPETGAHLMRTRNYCVLLAEKLAEHPKYTNSISAGFIAAIYDVAPMHDIGKVSIPDSILLKPGRLTPEEYEVMKGHPEAGAEAFSKVLTLCDKELFRAAHNVCLHHHEKWDGSGYPMRLSGDNIPVEARIMMIADIYDALLSKRVYKPALTYEETREKMRESAGTFFDPDMIDVMLDNISLFEEVHKKYQDD